MSDAERVALGTTLAGKNQYKVLASVMQNFSTATEATATALNSSGSAARENARYMESIEARVTAVSAAFQKMSMAVVDSDLVKGILDVVKGLADFGATDVGSTVTQILLLSGASWGGLQLLGQSILPGIMSSFGASEGIILGFKAALSGSLPVILAVVGGITTLIAIIKAIKSAYDAANPSVEEASLSLKNAQDSLQSVTESYESADTKLKELNSTRFEERSAEIDAEIERLQLLVQYYEQLQQARQGDVTEAASTYAKTVEKEGFATGKYTATYGYRDIRTMETPSDIPDWVIDTSTYQSFENAVLGVVNTLNAATGAQIEFTNATETYALLQRDYGVSIKENTLSVSELGGRLNVLSQAFTTGEEVSNNTIEAYKKLTEGSAEYAEAIRLLGDQATKGQQQFLTAYDNVTIAYESYIQSVADGNNITTDQAERNLQAAAALSTYAQNLLAAASAYDTFKNRLAETGDYDDSFKGLVSLFGEINSEMEKGQYGSQAMLDALNILTGQTFDYNSAQEYLNQNLSTLTTLFGDAESGGLGLITAMQNLQSQGDNTWGSITEVNGGLEVSITDFGALADSLGITEGNLYQLTEAARIFGVDFQYNVEDILGSIEGLGEGITSVQDGITHIDFAEFVNQAQSLNMTNEEIQLYHNLLQNAADVQLDNVSEGLSAINDSSGDATTGAESLSSALDDVSGFDSSSVVGGLNAIGNAAAQNAPKVGNLASALASLKVPGAFAEGTSHAKEGDALVNEEGAELIQSGDKAYIAGGGFPTIAHLHEGDKVYTAEETKDILKGGKLPNPIQAHVKGTLTGSGGSSGSKKVTSTGVGGGTASITAAILAGLKGQSRGGTSGSSSSSSSSTSSSSSSKSSSKDSYKDEFDEWLKAKKHALAMDQITEEEYYKALGEMNDKYFKGKKEYQDEYWKYQEQIYSWEKKQEEERAKAAAKAYEDEFKTWLDAQDHALAMDQITQEEYYTALEQMNDKYFKDREEYQDEYWRYEEKIYAWRKRQAEEEARAQEQALKDQIDLEKKLNDLAKAQASKVKVFENGQFRYISDREALAKAQEALSSYGNGTLSANGGLSLVGENGAEMRVLNKGDGVIPANITKNLWNWGSIDPSVFASKSSDNSIYNFDISNLDLPNVHNATDFVSGLKSFALQYIAQRG